MKVPEKPIKVAQLHLPLLAASKASISDEKQRELAVALIELLISATQENDDTENGGADELEADR